MVLAIDWDGVIHDWEHVPPGRRLGPPMLGAKDALIQLKEAGHHIIIHSCNKPGVIADWMAYFEIPYSSIWCGNGKVIADVYLDDRAVHFTSWEDLSPYPREWIQERTS